VNGVSAIRVHRWIARRRRHLTTLIAVLAVGGAVMMHHDGMAMGAIGDHHDMSVALELCLGVMTVVVTAVAVVAFGVLAPGHPGPTGSPSWPVSSSRLVRPFRGPGPALRCSV